MRIDGLLEKALAASRAGSHAGALQAVRQALAAAPELPRAHRVLATVLFRQGDLNAAETALLALGPLEDVAGLQLHAAILSRQGRTGEAIGRARQALALDPSDAGSHDQLGHLLDWQQRHGDRHRGHRRRRRAHECERHWEEALRLAPEHLPARVGLGARSLDFGELGRAKRFADEGLSIDPGHAAIRLLAGRIAWHRGDWSDARAHARSLLAERGADQAALELLKKTEMPGGALIRSVQRIQASTGDRVKPVLYIAALTCSLLLYGALPKLSPMHLRIVICLAAASAYLLLRMPAWFARSALRSPKLVDSF